jgi:signal transduction histidine kinase/MFS family permease
MGIVLTGSTDALAWALLLSTVMSGYALASVLVTFTRVGNAQNGAMREPGRWLSPVRAAIWLAAIAGLLVAGRTAVPIFWVLGAWALDVLISGWLRLREDSARLASLAVIASGLIIAFSAIIALSIGEALPAFVGAGVAIVVLSVMVLARRTRGRPVARIQWLLTLISGLVIIVASMEVPAELWGGVFSISLLLAGGMAFAQVLAVAPASPRDPSVAQRPATREQASAEDSDASPADPRSVQRRLTPLEAQSIQLMRSVENTLDFATPDHIVQQILIASLDLLKADVGVMLPVVGTGYVDALGAYDRGTRRAIAGLSFHIVPESILATAMAAPGQYALFPAENEWELADLYARLDIEEIGPAYIQSLTRGGAVQAVLLLGNPYSRRELASPDRELLKAYAILAGSLLMLTHRQEPEGAGSRQAVGSFVVESGISPAQRANLMEIVEAIHRGTEAEYERLNELAATIDGDPAMLTTFAHSLTGLESLRNSVQSLAEALEQLPAGAASGLDDRSVAMPLAGGDEPQQDLGGQQTEHALRGNTAQIEALRRENEVLRQDYANLEERLIQAGIQLRELGISGGAEGLQAFLANMKSARASLLNNYQRLQEEKRVFLRERESVEETLARLKNREIQVIALENQVQHLAEDREVAQKQRDKYRRERNSFANELGQVKRHRASVLAQMSGYEIELEELREQRSQQEEALAVASEERRELIRRRDLIAVELERARNAISQLQLAVGDDDAALIEAHAREIEALHEKTAEMKDEQEALLVHIEHQDARIEELEAKLAMDSDRYVQPVEPLVDEFVPPEPTIDVELTTALAEELRTPLTAVIGYTSLLVDESVGMLGDRQRRFMRRIMTNLERLDMMIANLTRTLEIRLGRIHVDVGPIDTARLLEDAISDKAVMFREKEQSLALSISEAVGPAVGDPSLLAEILGHLLTNAHLVTPPGGHIEVAVESGVMSLDGQRREIDAVMVAITDAGKGIPAHEQGRVFSGQYQADLPLIDGIGDTTVGLSLARTLVEMMGGQLVFESFEGSGTTFTLVLPSVAEVQEV